MRLELFSIPNDANGNLIKDFLVKNNLTFTEIITEDTELLNKIAQTKLLNKISILRVTYSHSIHVMIGYQENQLNQLIEHIKKYNQNHNETQL
ncbi:MAG: hypothetical protein Q7S74_00110 [Nanoarchaeota archaeon]|nr:hypothetical protein [Nanoarchaeota archaeon]